MEHKQGGARPKHPAIAQLVTSAECAEALIPDAPLPPPSQGTRFKTSGVSPLSLLTFFAAAKKVSAAPHRGNANRPPRIQGKANKNTTKRNRTPLPEGQKNPSSLDWSLN